MHKLITVTGVTAVGKDYLLDRSLAHMPHINRRNFGCELGEYLGIDRDLVGATVDRSNLRKAAEEVSKKMASLRPLFLSSHVVQTPDDRINEILPVESILNADSYVVVVAPPELIYERVQKRNELGERASQETSIDQIGCLQDHQLAVVGYVCGALCSQLIILENLPGNTHDNVERLQEIALTIAE